VGALAAGAPEHVVAGLASFGHELGIAFQLVDDVLGVVGDPARTGKSSSSDVRAGKCSAPIVAALADPSRTGEQLAQLFADGPPATEADVALATELIVEAGGVAWATQEADARLDKAIRQLENLKLVESAAADLAAVATYIVTRDR
jgi:geranylgeranyl diphosphate synthase type I